MIEEVIDAVSYQEAEAVLGVIQKTELKSGIRVNTNLNHGYFTACVFPPIPDRTLGYKEQDIADMYIGGVGITNRTLPQINKEIPGVEKRMLEETGKIVILGNGFSNVPLLLAFRFSEGQVRTPAVLVDLFDYSLTRSDLSCLKDKISSSGLAVPRNLPVYISTLSRICAQIDAGNLIAEKYYIGSENPPDSIKNANLVINCYGPDKLSIAEQASLLSQTGELYISEEVSALPEGFSGKRISHNEKKASTLIKRI